MLHELIDFILHINDHLATLVQEYGLAVYGILFLIGSMLFVFSFGLNAVTELYVKQRLIKRFQGK